MRLKGDAIEVLFEYEAINRGMTVSTPSGNMSSYDKVVDVAGSLYKVQIKGASSKNISVQVNVTKKTSVNRKIPYEYGDYDILAVYILNNDSWNFYRFAPNKKCYRINSSKPGLNNWDIFYEEI